MAKTCLNCKEKFEPKRKDQKYCKKEECVKEKIKSWKKSADKTPKKRKKCVACNVLFTPFHRRQKNCGKPDCKRYSKNEQRRKKEIEYECVVCNETSWSSNQNAKLCGNPECRKKYVMDFNKKNNYKQKLRKKIKKLSRKKGAYTIKEIRKLLSLKFNGMSHSDIAIELGRTYNSVDKKSRDIFKDEKFSVIITEEKEKYEMNKKRVSKPINYWNDKIKQIFKEIE